MTEQLKKFIQNNKNLINENSMEAWEEVYDKLNASPNLNGEFTTIMLSVGIDPAKILGYIPKYYLYGSNIANYKVPHNVTSIGERSLVGCVGLTEIIIPDNVTSIGYRAFAQCGSLKKVIIPDSVTYIDEGAFYDCDMLRSAVIGNGVTSIGDFAFADCDNLTSVKIGDNVTSIGKLVFNGCISLTSLIIPESVTNIGYNVFHYCNKLKEIRFGGTKEQAIQTGLKLESYREGSAIEKIICIDEVIEL